MAQMNDEPAFPVDGTDFEKLNNEDVKNLGYEVFVDDQTANLATPEAECSVG